MSFRLPTGANFVGFRPCGLISAAGPEPSDTVEKRTKMSKSVTGDQARVTELSCFLDCLMTMKKISVAAQIGNPYSKTK